MLVQDMLTGQLHEIPDGISAPRIGGLPDPQVYGLGEVYDGYGNSLGLFFLPKLIKKAVGAVGSVVRGITGGGGSRSALAPAPSQACPPCPPCPPCPQYPAFRTPLPAGMPPGYPFPYPPRPRRRRRRR
jgi:hypothetical protein